MISLRISSKSHSVFPRTPWIFFKDPLGFLKDFIDFLKGFFKKSICFPEGPIDFLKDFLKEYIGFLEDFIMDPLESLEESLRMAIYTIRIPFGGNLRDLYSIRGRLQRLENH